MRDKRTEANMNTWLEKAMACQETTETRLYCEKPTSEDMEPETEHQENMDAWIAGMNDGRKERTACQEKTETNPGEHQRSPRKKPQ
jgi:hypothetical protein